MNYRMLSLFHVASIAALIMFSMPSLADRYGFDEIERKDDDDVKCRSDPQCMAMFQRYQAKQAEQERQKDLQDQELKDSDPPAYCMTVFGRFLGNVLLVVGVIGAYTFLFGLGGKKK